MVLISLHPFAFKKIVLLAAAILGLSSVACFADSLFMSRRYAPSGQRASSGTTERALPHTASSAPLSMPVYANIEGGEAGEQRFPEAANSVITPFMNQVGHRPACVRRAEAAVDLAWTAAPLANVIEYGLRFFRAR